MDTSKQYELLAEEWANHIGKPFTRNNEDIEKDIQLLIALWNVYPEVIECIEIDPLAFADRVDNYRYGIAMEK